MILALRFTSCSFITCSRDYSDMQSALRLVATFSGAGSGMLLSVRTDRSLLHENKGQAIYTECLIEEIINLHDIF